MHPIVHSKPWLTGEDKLAVEQVLSSGMLAQGHQVHTFEKSVATYFNEQDAGVAFNSGTAALQAALIALNVSVGDEVILPTYVCESVLFAVRTLGASPVLCDVSENWCITKENVASLVSARTKAIIYVHLFGIYSEIEALQSLNVPIIEDFCQCFGALQGAVKRTGEFAVLSFHATKCLTTAEGGMVLADKKHIHHIREIRDGGSAARVFSPMSDLQAAVGLSQVNRYPQFIEKRKALFAYYCDALSGVVKAILPSDKGLFPLFRFVLQVESEFDGLQQQFAREGIHLRRGVDKLLHRDEGLSDAQFATATSLWNETISIPYYPALTHAEAQRVVDVCKKYLKG